LLAVDVIEKLFFNYTVRHIRYFHPKHNGKNQIDTISKS